MAKDSSPVPEPATVAKAHANLLEVIGRASQAGDGYRSDQELVAVVRDGVRRFAEIVCAIPGGERELKRRASFVWEHSRPGSPIAKLVRAAHATRALVSPRPEYVPPATRKETAAEFQFVFQHGLDAKREELEQLDNPTATTEELRQALMRLSDEANHLEADGCVFLLHVRNAARMRREKSLSFKQLRTNSPILAALATQEFLERGPAWVFDAIASSADSLRSWGETRIARLSQNGGRCLACREPLSDYGLDHDHGWCDACRSQKGKVADLLIALRAKGDSPERLGGQWITIRGLIYGKLNHSLVADPIPESRLADWLEDWLRREHGREQPLAVPLQELVAMLQADTNAIAELNGKVPQSRRGKGSQNPKPNRGRRKKYDEKEDERIAKEWQAAKRQGAYMGDFVREREMTVAGERLTVKGLKRLQSRVRSKRRKRNS